ncbi:MAG: flavin reductase family protein [Succinivibrio sp.]
MNSDFIKVNPDSFDYSAFSMIGSDWLQITAADESRVNTMTASWGGLGVMFNKKAAFVFIRPQRYTKTIVDAESSITLQVLPKSMRDISAYFGRASGANEDKIGKSGVAVQKENGHVYFEQSEVVMFCKRLYSQDMLEECFSDSSIVDTWYKNKDFHAFYILEIKEIYVKKNSRFTENN